MLFALSTSSAFAQNTLTQRVTLVAHPILELKVDNSFKDLDFTLNTNSDYTNGKKMPQALILQVNSNNNWLINIKANSETFIPHTMSGEQVNANVLAVNQAGLENGVALNTSEQPLVHGSYGGFDVNRFAFDYKLSPGYIKPDIYELAVTFTLTAP